MSQVIWRFAVAIGIAVFALVIWLALYPEQPRLFGNAGYENQASNYIAGDCDLTSRGILLGRERALKNESCSEAREEHRLKVDDLIQQRRAADAAEASAIYAFGQTRVAVWGLSLGFLTLVAAGAAAWYAKRAADIAKRAAEAAEAASHNEQRAWVVIDTEELQISQADGAIHLGINTKVSNVGKTPARSIKRFAKLIPQSRNTEKVTYIKTTYGTFERKYWEIWTDWLDDDELSYYKSYLLPGKEDNILTLGVSSTEVRMDEFQIMHGVTYQDGVSLGKRISAELIFYNAYDESGRTKYRKAGVFMGVEITT